MQPIDESLLYSYDEQKNNPALREGRGVFSVLLQSMDRLN